ncbi:MAG TPA: hypothetical protein VM935_06490 [Chitinophagaceae bacterium]|jgi:hypothetical protein|nr:hypothetical protein [Chitinophagaceae bacterium]
MNFTLTIRSIYKIKLITALCIIASLAAVASLGDGGKKATSSLPGKRLLSLTAPQNFKYFSLKSGYDYRGNKIFSPIASKYILLNTVVTYQKGSTTYILPLRKKVLLEKVKFNPAQ